MTGILQQILEYICGFVNNNGWGIVIFTLLIRFILMPLDVKSRKSMRKTALIQPEVERLQKKYANDKQKLNQKIGELYKKEKVSPLSGCIPMLIQWPVLLWMFGAMRVIANEHMVEQIFNLLANSEPILPQDSWLWIKNVYASDSFFASVVPTATNLQMIGTDVWQNVYERWVASGQWANVEANLSGIVSFETPEQATATINMFLETVKTMDMYTDYVQTVPGWNNVRVLFFSITVYIHNNGYLVLPVLAGVSQILMTKLNPQANGAQQPANSQQASSANSMGKFMQVFFPILSVYFCLTSNAGFAIYWVTSNIIMGAQTIVINKILDNKDKQQTANA